MPPGVVGSPIWYCTRGQVRVTSHGCVVGVFLFGMPGVSSLYARRTSLKFSQFKGAAHDMPILDRRLA